MPEALRFDFDAAPVETPVPFRGNTTASSHASWTGARVAVRTWSARQSEYLQLLDAAGPMTDQDAAGVTNRPLASINSVRNALVKRFEKFGLAPPIVPAGSEPKTWDSGQQSQRTRWHLRDRASVLLAELRAAEGAPEE